MIAAAAVVLAVVGWLVVRKPAAAPVPVVAATPVPSPVIADAPTPVPTVAAPSAAEQKAAQVEAQRLLALRRTPRAGEPKPTTVPKAPAVVAAAPKPAAPTAAPRPPEPTPEVKVAQAPPPAPVEPTAVPAPAEPPPTAAPRAAAPAPVQISRGDLVGPGEGVVEPALLSYPRIAYPAAARQQQIAGKVVVLVLVNEEGAASDVKLQQGVAARFGVNEVVLEALRHAKFRPASKNGIPVKMWRTIVVDVKP
jgi:TonB family protein